jgi:hypothetical protein
MNIEIVLWKPPTLIQALANHSQEQSADKQRLSKHVSTEIKFLDKESVAR